MLNQDVRVNNALANHRWLIYVMFDCHYWQLHDESKLNLSSNHINCIIPIEIDKLLE